MLPTPRHLSSAFGRILQVLLVRPGYSLEDEDPSLRDLITCYESHGIEALVLEREAPISKSHISAATSDFTIAHPMVAEMLQKGLRAVLKADMDLAAWQREFEVIAELELSLVHSEWAQDGFAVLEYDNHYQILLQSLSSRRFLDQFISFELALKRQLGFLLMPTLADWEGGNILVGDDMAIVGKNTLAINWRNTLLRLKNAQIADPSQLNAAFETMKRDMQVQLGVSELIWMGYPSIRRDLANPSQFCYQPVFHIDLHITLGGKNGVGEQIIFIADPGLAWRLLREAGLAATIRKPGLEWDGEALTEQMIDYSISRDTRQFFENYNDMALPSKFQIVSLPMLIEAGVFYTWNNSLIEVTQHKARAFVPNYIMTDARFRPLVRTEIELNQKIEVLQQAVSAIFTAHGITEVIWAGHGMFMQQFAQRMGSLHCLTKVLRREAQERGSRS